MPTANRLAWIVTCCLLAACGSGKPADPIVVDGSSTLAPLTAAVVKFFEKSHRTMPVTLSSAGTVEGFKR